MEFWPPKLALSFVVLPCFKIPATSIAIGVHIARAPDCGFEIVVYAGRPLPWNNHFRRSIRVEEALGRPSNAAAHPWRVVVAAAG